MTGTKSYEQMTDREFWAEVRGLLETCQRHHPGTTWADHVGSLADYVRAEIERREPRLAANRAEALRISRDSWNRELAKGTDVLDAWCAPMSEADTARLTSLWDYYRGAVVGMTHRHTRPEAV